MRARCRGHSPWGVPCTALLGVGEVWCSEHIQNGHDIPAHDFLALPDVALHELAHFADLDPRGMSREHIALMLSRLTPGAGR